MVRQDMEAGRDRTRELTPVMLIILTIYLVLVWLIFSRLNLVRWGWGSGSVAVLIGAFILAVFMAMFNYLTPSGSFVVISRVVVLRVLRSYYGDSALNS